jgi:hypothetical protein
MDPVSDRVFCFGVARQSNRCQKSGADAAEIVIRIAA